MSETAVEPLAQRPDPAEEARDAAKEPSTDVYHNPLESSSRMGLAARAYAYRTGAAIAFGMGNMVPPVVPSPAKTVYFDSTLSAKYSGRDKIKADVWTPDRPRSLSRRSSRSSVRSNKSKSGRSKKNKNKADADAAAADGLDSLNPSLSRFESAVSVTDDEAPAAPAAAQPPPPAAKKRPSTISRISSRLSTASSKSLRSKSSLSLPNTPSAAANTTDPMEQIPTMLTPQADPRARRPAVVNFHGGGFVLGQATDDGRWAMAVMQALGAVVFSVEYRLAPSYPFPTPVEDCADAILQIWRRADEFWIDPDKIILSGFSAGGTLALASWTLLADYKRWGYDVRAQPSSSPPQEDLAARASKMSLSDNDTDGSGPAADVPQPAGLMLFYPLLDWTQSRPRKRLTCAKPELTLPRNLTDIFDAAYLYPPDEIKSQLDNPLLSPGLLPDDLVDRLPPVQMCLCEYDMLLAEGRRFVDRLRARGKRDVGYRVVEGAKHAWDKPLPFSPPENLGVEYGEAVRVMAGWIGREEGNGSGDDLPPREAGGGGGGGSNGAGGEGVHRYGDHLEVS